MKYIAIIEVNNDLKKIKVEAPSISDVEVGLKKRGYSVISISEELSLSSNNKVGENGIMENKKNTDRENDGNSAAIKNNHELSDADKGKKYLKEAKSIIHLFIVIIFSFLCIWWYVGGGQEIFIHGRAKRIEENEKIINQEIRENAKIITQEIRNTVASDMISQYEMAKRNGDKIEIAVHAGMVASAFLQSGDEGNYRKWKEIERQDRKMAGLE